VAPADARLIRRGVTALALSLVLLGLPAPAAAQGPRLTVPAGFAIDVFSDAVGSPRFMALDPAGTLLVSEPARGRVLALPDRNNDGKADSMQVVVDGLDAPHGLAFHEGQLYVAEMGRVLRFTYDPASMKATERKVLVPDLPRGGHWTRTVVFGPDGRMYVSVGSSCNVCRENDRRRAAVLRYSASGGGEQIFSSGLRNAVGLAFHPTTGVLWATVNERDNRGDDVPPDYVTEIREGTFHGWPDCMVVGGKVMPDPSYPPGTHCTGVTPPVLEIQAHSAPIGLVFYTGSQFPEEHRGSLFVAYRGSWNRRVPTGYKIVRIPFRDGRPSGPPEDFATGWLEGRTSMGRPVDLMVGRDGALYLSTQDAGRIYRITHRS